MTTPRIWMLQVLVLLVAAALAVLPQWPWALPMPIVALLGIDLPVIGGHHRPVRRVPPPEPPLLRSPVPDPRPDWWLPPENQGSESTSKGN